MRITKVTPIDHTSITGARGHRVIVRPQSRVKLLPYRMNTPNGSMGICLSRECRLLLLKILGSEGPHTVVDIVKASNRQILLCFSIGGKKVMLRSLYFYRAT